ncbi:Rieske 2Fe-2S domain-containing protein [Marinobacter adhaerens]|jgi:benzoate/toluate 1,2-dioxygenase alpha subunit|nr:Rieske 2Fe-2S domain-containing protein [Marinobacter adhaerens]ADP96870.1 Rieske (2Fe-2S) domain protein [Marinobacter adhaerens HP15]
MKYIFEGNWVYLAHESQIQENNDFFTTYIGRHPIIITRDKSGNLNAFLNICTHRGAMLCRSKKGNKSVMTCPFHGWSFNNSGKLVKVKDEKGSGYPDSFNCEGELNLKNIAKFDSYRGFLFGSLNSDVQDLNDYLGDTTKIIDMIVDQSEDEIEVLRGASTYTFDGNWKVQAENGVDGYHVSAVHWNYVATVARRKQGLSEDSAKSVDLSSWNKQKGGSYAFKNGHTLLWMEAPNPQDRPLAEKREELSRKYGKNRADWMISNIRNLGIYPNVFLMDQTSTQIRHFRPISVNKTEVTIYCFAPKNESGEARNRRIRQYEDFFNATGMATPDDLEQFNSSQISFHASKAPWNDLSRGAKHWIDGQDKEAESIDIFPLLSGVKSEDEGLFVMQHECWANALLRGMSDEEDKVICKE